MKLPAFIATKLAFPWSKAAEPTYAEKKQAFLNLPAYVRQGHQDDVYGEFCNVPPGARDTSFSTLNKSPDMAAFRKEM